LWEPKLEFSHQQNVKCNSCLTCIRIVQGVNSDKVWKSIFKLQSVKCTGALLFLKTIKSWCFLSARLKVLKHCFVFLLGDVISVFLVRENILKDEILKWKQR
jgi:hypothetical protein